MLYFDVPQNVTKEQYYKSLPKKQVGTAILFFNEKKEILLLKPNYKDSWIIPGGANNENESPLECALRETKEEIGLDISKMKLVGIYHSLKNTLYPDSLKFIFFGGILTDNEISQIKIQNEEIKSYTFKESEEAIPLLSVSLRNSIPDCLKAIKENTFAYLDEHIP